MLTQISTHQNLSQQRSAENAIAADSGIAMLWLVFYLMALGLAVSSPLISSANLPHSLPSKIEAVAKRTAIARTRRIWRRPSKASAGLIGMVVCQITPRHPNFSRAHCFFLRSTHLRAFATISSRAKTFQICFFLGENSVATVSRASNSRCAISTKCAHSCRAPVPRHFSTCHGLRPGWPAHTR